MYWPDGSPPRVWGIRRLHGLAGNAVGSPPRVWGIPAHATAHVRHISGSPPRVWGIHYSLLAHSSPVRFTPTCVGNTYANSIFLIFCSVHPHVCGEYGQDGSSCAQNAGSPPRVWGIRLDDVLDAELARFTPTCVGNTFFAAAAALAASVHPHVCGEY